MNKKLNYKGFTLIEVILVLAIGALIFLLAFLAFQQVQTNRRDSARRADAGRFIAEVSNYASDNNGSVPTQAVFNGTFKDSYLNNPKDPKGNNYNFGTSLSNESDVLYTPGTSTGVAGCGGGTLKERDAKVQIKLEKGVACRDTL